MRVYIYESGCRQLSTLDKNAKHLNYMSQEMGNDDPSVRRLSSLLEDANEGEMKKTYEYAFHLRP